MLIAQVRLATASEHEALEHSLPLLDPNLTITSYINTVQSFEAFLRQWELVGSFICPATMKQTFDARNRSVLLARDLHSLGASALGVTPSLAFVATPAAFLGAMYVMEGSTLGGQLIARHLEKVFGFRDGIRYSFFRGHGPDTGRYWKEFCCLLEEEGTRLDPDAVVNGAKGMFLALHEWFESMRPANV